MAPLSSPIDPALCLFFPKVGPVLVFSLPSTWAGYMWLLTALNDVGTFHFLLWVESWAKIVRGLVKDVSPLLPWVCLCSRAFTCRST